MATTGNVLATANNADDASYAALGTPDNVHTDDTNSASALGSGGGQSVRFYTGFDFATAGLGSGDTVTDVQITVKIYDNYGDTGTAWSLYWDDSTGTVFDTVISGVTATRFPTSGSSTGTSGTPEVITRSIQGTQPTATELLSSNFQIPIINEAIDGFTEDARINVILIDVTYTPVGGGANPHNVFGHPFNGPFAGPIG